jgi:hypothetical protein
MEGPMNLGAAGQSVSSELPPLILHPFNERVTPSDLLENSKAALMLSGLLPPDGVEPDELSRRLLAGRYSEIRMLFFLGRDIFRWIEQCLEWGQRFAGTETPHLTPQNFAWLLTKTPPQEVRDKLMRWGVADYSSIFSRAIGLNAVFTEPPEPDTVSPEFVRNYHRYADALFRAYMQGEPNTPLNAARFHFELYASGEYSRKLESEWEQE